MSLPTHDHHDHHDHTNTPSHTHVQPGHDYAAFNKDHFDKEAQNLALNPPAAMVEMTSRISAAILAEYPFDENSTTVLDYACGVGMMSQAIASETKSIVGVDISPGSVEQYNLRVSNQGIAPDEMKAIATELKGVEGELDNAKFDVVICTMAYHHFASIQDTTRTLAFFLKPGGYLIIADIMRKDEYTTQKVPEKYAHMVPHTHGFTEQEIKDTFSSAGLTDIDYKSAVNTSWQGQPMEIFLAKGKKVA